jgi:hypothetical protein
LACVGRMPNNSFKPKPLHAVQSAADDPDTGGGPAVLETARNEKTKMLKAAPELLEPAKALLGQLVVARHER